MRRIKAHLPALSLFCLALLVRIVYNLTVAWNYTPVFDAAIYNNLARAVVNFHCYCSFRNHPAYFRPPLWPLIIATIYTIGGEHSSNARLFYCLLDSGTCVLVYFLARDLFGKRVALFTGLIAAVYPGLFVWTGWLYSETLYTFCLTAGVFALMRVQQSIPPHGLKIGKTFLRVSRHRWRWIICSGCAIGLTMLTRPTGSLLLGLLGTWALLVISGKMLPWREVITSTLAILLIATTLNLPWLYRNYTLTHSLLPISTIGTTLVGDYDDTVFQGTGVARGMWLPPAGTINPDFSAYTAADEKMDTARALAWMHAHPGATLELIGLHLLNMWTPYSYAHGLPFEEFPGRLSSQLMLFLIPITAIPIFLLALAGLFATWQRFKKHLLIAYLVIAITILQNIVFYGSPRYRAPIEPLLVLLAGGLLWWFLSEEPGTFRHLRARRTQAPAGEISAVTEAASKQLVIATHDQ